MNGWDPRRAPGAALFPRDRTWPADTTAGRARWSLQLQVREDVVVDATLIGVQGVVARTGKPLAGRRLLRACSCCEVLGGQWRGRARFERLAQLRLDRAIDHCAQIGAGERLGLLRKMIEVEVLDRFAPNMEPENRRARRGIWWRDEEDPVEATGSSERGI